MNAQQWERAKKVFDAALQVPQAERSAFVVTACNDDLDLINDIMLLLEADDNVGSFLDAPAVTPRLPLRDNTSSLSLLRLLPPGEVISGRFEIKRFLGQGGMGQVYEADDVELGVTVALKTLRPEISSNEYALARFRKEVQLTRRVTHRNVCRVFDIGKHTPAVSSDTNSSQPFAFLTMELLSGYTLAELLRQKKRLSTTECLPIAEQVAEGLTAAHRLGIVHRDVKPSNILLVPDSTSTRAVVTDFGLARSVTPRQTGLLNDSKSLTAHGYAVGTLAYMAPEQLTGGEITPATDVYAFGLVLYEMITGVKPWDARLPFGGIAQRLTAPPPSPKTHISNLPDSWDTAIQRCLNVEPGARFRSAEEVVRDIASDQSAIGARSVVLPLAKKLIKPQANPSRRKWLLGGAVFLFVALALFAVLLRYYKMKASSGLAEGGTVLLTDIKNNTGDPRFDSVTDLLRRQLSQSAFIHVMTNARIDNALERMTKKGDPVRDPATAREVALRAGARRVIFGAISRIGDNYTLDLDIEQPSNDPASAEAQWSNHWNWSDATSADSQNKGLPSGLIEAVRSSANWVRHEIGEAANDIARLDTPPQDVTTDNWDALSQFTMAERFDARQEDDNAVVALQNAVAADPHFAFAWMKLGDILVSMRRYEEGYKAYQTALSEENRRLTRKERDRLRGIFALDTGDYAAAVTSFRDYAVYYPNDYLAWFYQAYPLMMLGRVEEALTVLDKAQQIDPTAFSTPAHIARFNLILGHYPEARVAIQRLRDIGHPDDADDIEAAADFLQGNYPRTLELYSKLKHSKEAVYRTRSYLQLACALAELRRYDEAIASLNEGLESDKAEGDIADSADKLLARAYLEVKTGNYQAVLEDTEQSLKLDRSLQRSAAAASILSVSADRTSAPLRNAFINDLHKIQDSLPSASFFPVSLIVDAKVKGELLLAQQKPNRALEQMEIADKLDAPAVERDYLARALLSAANKVTDTKVAGEERLRAKAAFGKIALHPGRVWQLPEDFPPGFWKDEVESYAQIASAFLK